MGSLVGMAGPWSGWLLGPALCEGCWLLRQGSVMSLLAAVPEICVPGMCVPGLVLAHWWAELGFGVGGCRAVQPLMSSISLLMGRVSS